NCMCSVPESYKECNSNQPLVFTDSEWDENLPGKWISTAFAFEDGSVKVYFTDQVPDNVRALLQARAAELSAGLEFIHRDENTRLLPEGEYRLGMYYSGKDVEYAVGREAWKCMIDKDLVRQQNNISSTPQCELKIIDLKGWAGVNVHGSREILVYCPRFVS